MRKNSALETQDIRTRSIEHEMNLDAFSKMGTETFLGGHSVCVIAICNLVADVGGRQGFQYLRMRTGPVVARKSAGLEFWLIH